MRGAGGSTILLFAACGAVAALTASAGSLALLGDALGADDASPRPLPAPRGAPLDDAVLPLPPAPALGDPPAPRGAFSSFDILAGFRYDADGPTAGRAASIPPEVMALDGQTVTIRGFMVPVTLDGAGGVRSFLLTENQLLCCYGVMPALNEWIAVEVKEGASVPLHVDRPIDATGLLAIGESTDEGGTASLYRMTAERVTAISGHRLRGLGGR